MTHKRARRLAAEWRAVADALRHVSLIIAQLEVAGQPGIVGTAEAAAIAAHTPYIVLALETLANRFHPQP